MKADRETKRLFVGGLGQAISETDLQNQFSRFGEVSDVEIITRKDDQGNPQKVFAYINIRVTEADLKKCMSVLNKTKWKGGTLQIQLAKESFLHRLAQERKEAKAKKEKSTAGNTNLVEKMGGVDFHMKAVPGTEVPGHKNWVVSKFGRVLPVLHLKNQHKRKIMKYDPSKYCHNIKKIEEGLTSATPISNLTWELEGGNDPMSKKRRGEFSDFHDPPRKITKVQKKEHPPESLARSPGSNWVMESPHLPRQRVIEKTPCDFILPSKKKALLAHGCDAQKLKNVLFQTSGLETHRKRSSMSDDNDDRDTDSEDELRAMIAKEETLQRITWSSIKDSENETFEVVSTDFKSDAHRLCSLTGLGIKTNASRLDGDALGNDCEYDSGDTDEIVAVKNSKVKNEQTRATEFSEVETSIHKKISFKNRENGQLSHHCIEVPKRNNAESDHGHGIKPRNCKSPSDSRSSEDADFASELAESEGDEEYDTMMKDCIRVNLTLADLEQLAGHDPEVPKEDSESSGPATTTHCKSDCVYKSPRIPHGPRRDQQGISPEEILASLLEEENTYSKPKPMGNNLKPKFQAFKGVGSLYGEDSVRKSLKENGVSVNVSPDQNSLKQEGPNSTLIENESPYANILSSKLTPCQHAKTVSGLNHIQLQKRQAPSKGQDHKVVYPRGSEKGSQDSVSRTLLLKGKKSLSPSAETPKMSFDQDSWHSATKREAASEEDRADSSNFSSLEKSPKVSSRKDTQENRTDFSLSSSDLPHGHAQDKHAADNQKRLAALEARQKAKDVQKKLVHDALAKLDGHPEDKPTHIIFGSDSESGTEERPTQGQNHPGEKLVKESLGKASGKLFDSSDNEDSDSEDDSNRFKIKPQFEGKAGQKLMDLQSHFGNDDRFRMDSRFLESDSEEEQEEVNEGKTAEEDELAAERARALHVVQSVLHVNLSSATSRGSAAAKKFKDIIRYDPTRHDHATYERKRDEKPKESKAKRKKKREEAEKLPEVSKDMYYNITMDLKEIFQTTKDTSKKEEDTPWNGGCGGERAKAEPPSAFTFSFFGSDTKDVKEETYKIGTVKSGKVIWKGDPRFQDSSSEDDDTTEETDQQAPSPRESSLPEKETPRFFFFSKDDERLHGCDLFWKGVGSNISRNSWEARAHSLHMDCRKKHKDAKRKVKQK
ncbi:nucleolar protein 8 isoform X1 [Tupaia chinensis]|uniref:nucleolar protein 8 isoform X1 n=3 Tax=Tupaia chinensis TaxID=246437 RepID=UPI0003C8F40D|nr:nucleolar protein 8 isoform X1 [Tupaia chinensis]XP_014448294.1 nucleolar protein 8 isoform X1 [Tupaia chinensis]